MSKCSVICLIAVVVAVCLCSGMAGADVVYNTINSSNPFPPSGDAVFDSDWGYQSVANRFTVSGTDYQLDTIQIAGALWSGGNSLIVSLLADNAGSPGSIIEQITADDVFQTQGNEIISVDSSTNPLLQDGSSYWLALAPGTSDTSVNWVDGALGIREYFAYDPGSGWIAYDDAISNGFTIHGSAPAPVPEPSSLLVLVSGLGATGGILWRRRR